MFKKVLVAVTAIVVVGFVASVAIRGFDRTWTDVRAAADRAEQSVDESSSDEHLQQVIRVKIKDFDAQLMKSHSDLAKLDDRLAAAQSAVEEKRRYRAGQLLLLANAKQLLDQELPSYVIADSTVSREQLMADAELRLASCDRLKKEIDVETKLAQRLKAALDSGRKNLVEAQKVRQQFVAELETDRVRLKIARTEQEVAQLTAVLGNLPSLQSDSECAVAMSVLKDRVRDEEAKADFLANKPKADGLIAWDSRPDVRQAISKLLTAEKP